MIDSTIELLTDLKTSLSIKRVSANCDITFDTKYISKFSERMLVSFRREKNVFSL